jgi:hypothetical protein
MSITSRRWIGTALIAVAAIVLFASTTVVDVPGPMEASKPEFTFEFSPPFAILAGVFALSGIAFVAMTFRGRHEHAA